MGCQSQRCMGSVKSCKKKGTKTKYKTRRMLQKAVFGGFAFDSKRHCAVCKAKHVGYPPPHRSHDHRCIHNSKTHGLSKWSVEVDKIAARNIQINNAPLPNVNGMQTGTSAVFKKKSSIWKCKQGKRKVSVYDK
jgi:hypothetical protein